MAGVLAIPAIFFAIASWALGRRASAPTSTAHEDTSDPTAALSDLSRSIPSEPVRVALDDAFLRASADGGSAYGTAADLAALERVASSPAPAASSPAPAAAVPAELRDVEPARVPLDTPAATTGRVYVAPAESVPTVYGTVTDSPESSARKLHAYIMRTSSGGRDRGYIAGLQRAMGGVADDGLIGRGTAARILALTGLRIPGLS